MHKTVKNSETRMQGLVETVHGINLEERCEKSIQKLQVRINLVSRRTEKALSCLKKMEEKATPQNELKKICKDEALTVAITDISHEETPPILTPCGSPECTKNNTRNHQDQEPSPRIHHEHEEKDQAESWITYPPLPATTSPSVLSSTAVLYSIPQKLEVNLALINPTQLSVLWDVVEKDPFAPPMESYTIFLAMEKVKGSDVFSDWHTYKKVEALALPMRALIKKYKKRGHRVCAAVLGKDIFGRYGPYSDVVTATMPE
ncbi:activating transcription factor 7-interacting protein 1-like [Cololabis saira]|uniref:activating transcription factor 7-interacting protein 1-like n=1 Tax=Cololabis saira TaxID=129043 RepID=UPI002AD3D6B4|nr:activating transcription factor 7-interacting protein 1-like [Cololabis saira]